MRITDIKTYCVEAVRRNWVFLEVETDEGITGVGEVSSTGFAKTMEMAVWDFKRLLIGENPLEIERLWEYLYRRKFWRQDLILCTALSGIEMALWDIKGKECGKPVYELLGGPTRTKVKAYANYWFMGAKSVSDYAKMAAAAVEKGYTALKWSPFGKSAHSVTTEELAVIVECVKRVREAVGPRIDLLLDAHGRFNLPTARRVLSALEEYNLFFVEEALPPENIDAFVELKRMVKVPLATGERLVTRYQFRDLLAKFAVDYIQPDTLHCGGISETRKIAAMAEAYYVPLVPHNPGGPVSTASMIHVAASIPNFEVLEFIHVPNRENILKDPLVWEDGYFHLPTKPGLGVELNHKECAKFPYEPRDLDHYSDVRVIKME
jgi:galactonate dehydratase